MARVQPSPLRCLPLDHRRGWNGELSAIHVYENSRSLQRAPVRLRPVRRIDRAFAGNGRYPGGPEGSASPTGQDQDRCFHKTMAQFRKAGFVLHLAPGFPLADFRASVGYGGGFQVFRWAG